MIRFAYSDFNGTVMTLDVESNGLMTTPSHRRVSKFSMQLCSSGKVENNSYKELKFLSIIAQQ